ncbi:MULTISPECIES: hypothetical protein [unclassified Carboxylicivirga]|uniref:hypothetical protein n=1 Tax=Carboxylicivirga TaxID=1628153 RepID=UPI003D349F68
MKKVLFVIYLITLIQFGSANELKYISLGSNEIKTIINTSITSRGGHMGKCLTFNITNQSDKELFLKLDRGWKLIPEDDKFQNMFVVKECQFSIKPKATYSFDAIAYCCQAFDSAPVYGCKFKMGYIEERWVDVAQIIDLNDFSDYNIQTAIWSLSDNYSINRIQANNSKEIEALKKAVIKANPKSDFKVVNQPSKHYLRTAQDSIDYLKRMELYIRERVNWQPIGEEGVFDYIILSKSKKGGWKDAKGVLSIVGREITYIDSIDSNQNIKLLMGEVKRDTMNFGKGKLMISDICIAKRTDVANDRKNYRFTLNHFLDSDFYSATLSEWSKMQKIFNLKVQPIKLED